MGNLQNRRVAVLATDGVEQVELLEPVSALREAGARGWKLCRPNNQAMIELFAKAEARR